METPTILQGNTFTLAIPLRVYIIDEGGVVLEDYTPDEGDEVVITLKGPRRFYTYAPRIDGNVARIDIGGYEICGLYSVAVAITKDDGQKLRTYRGAQLSIVESIDAVTDSELEQGIEQGVLYLDAATFLSGADGRGIESVVKTAASGLVDTYTITYTDGTTSTFDVTNGHDGEDGQPGAPGTPGEDGVGILSIAKTGTVGLVDIYTIALTNGNTTTFEVTNGKDGITPDMSDYYTKQQTNTLLGNKADKAMLVGVSSSDSGWVADKSAADIAVAVAAGREVEVVCDGLRYRYIANLGAAHMFQGFDNNLGLVTWLIGDSVARAVTEVQEALVSGESIKTINNGSLLGNGNLSLATQEALSNFCPIIEDTRTSAVANITGLAPFSQLVDGQEILLHFAYNSYGTSSLTLTLSDSTATAAIPMYVAIRSNGSSPLTSHLVQAGAYIPFKYIQSSNRWVSVGVVDTNDTYVALNTAELTTGTSTTSRTISAKVLRDNFYLKSESDANYLPTLVEVAATGDVSQALDSGKFYRFGVVDSLALTFNAPQAGMGSYGGKFTASADWSVLSLPATIDEAAGNDTISAGKRYEFQSFDNVIVIKEV